MLQPLPQARASGDRDTLTPPFVFEAQMPSGIKFRPLKEVEERTAERLYAWFKYNHCRQVQRIYVPHGAPNWQFDAAKTLPD